MTHDTVIGIDLAKSVFQIAIMADGKLLSNQRVNRPALREFMINREPTIVAMEACYSSHYWAREFQRFGHEVKLIPAQHVKPFTRGNKTDANDAIAIIEASQRPNLRLVPVKTIHQQDIQNLHRIRERLIRNRTALINQIRGLLSEYGIVARCGRKALLLAIQDAMNDDRISAMFKHELESALNEWETTSNHIADIEVRLKEFVSSNENCRILHSIPGIGIINASALVSKFGNASQFDQARSLPVTLGLTPKLTASGDRRQMHGISKRGDPYLRKQLIHGARVLLMFSPKRKDDPLCRWALRIKQRRGQNIAVVALANRMARLAWVLLQKRELYKPMPL